MASPQGDKNFTRISNEIMEALSKTDLSNYEFRVYIMILRKTYGYQKKTDWISLSQLAKITGIKLSHISRTIKKLQEKNMIVKNGKVTGIQKDYDQWKLPKQVTNQAINLSENVTQIGNLPKQVTKVTQTGNKMLPKQGYTKDNKERIHIYNVEHYSEIINYLNEKADTKYKTTTEKTIDLIKARFNEGFTIEDFKIVIDKKIKSWTGTEWEKFIRPVTLFGTKFESYLNEKIVKKDKGDDYFRA